VAESTFSELEAQEGSKQLETSFNGGSEKTLPRVSFRDQHTTSLDPSTIPIRRRSLMQTPGVATRNSWRGMVRIPERIQKSSPVTRAQTWRRSAPNFQNGFGFRKPERTQTMPSEDEIQQFYYDQFQHMPPPDRTFTFNGHDTYGPRLSTPTEMGHIGAFKLGTLRITNGCPSPGPSVLSDVEDKKENTKNQTKNSNADHPLPSPTPVQKRSPVVAEFGSHHRFFAELNGDQPPTNNGIKSPISAKSPSFAHERTRAAKPSLEICPQIPIEAVDSYKLDMDFVSSPFSFYESMPSSPQLEATSKNTASDDHLFDAEPGSAVSLTYSMASERDLQRISGADHLNRNDELAVPGIRKSISQRSSERAMKEVKFIDPMPLAKTDSGYSSNASLRSLKSRRSVGNVRTASPSPVPPPVPEKAAPITPPKQGSSKRLPAKPADIIVNKDQPKIEDFAPTPPLKDTFRKKKSKRVVSAPDMKSPFYQPFSREAAKTEPVQVELPRPPLKKAPPVPPKDASPRVSFSVPVVPPKSERRKSSPKVERTHISKMVKYGMPLNANGKPQSQHSSSGSDASMQSVLAKRSRQKRNSQPLAVQADSTIEPAREPPVSSPEEILGKHQEDVPAVNQSQQTLSQQSSAVEPVEPARTPLSPSLSYSTSCSGSSNGNTSLTVPSGSFSYTDHHEFPMISYISDQNDIVQHNQRQSRESSRTRNTSQEFRRKKDFEQHITSFGTVAESLGASPYDAALNAMGSPTRIISFDDPTSQSDDQDSVYRGRAIGMDSATASHFAHERSQLREKENERREELSRRQSYDGRLRSDYTDGYQNQGARPISMTSSIPPMPTLCVEDMHKHSLMKKTKSPPPVSMRRQRSFQNFQQPPSRAPVQDPIERSTSAQSNPVHVSKRLYTPLSQPSPTADSWEAHRKAWSEKRRSAGEALIQSQPSSRRSSIDNQRSGSANSSACAAFQPPRRPTSVQPYIDQRRVFSLPNTPKQLPPYPKCSSNWDEDEVVTSPVSVHDTLPSQYRLNPYSPIKSASPSPRVPGKSFDPLSPNNSLLKSKSQDNMRARSGTVDAYSGFGYENEIVPKFGPGLIGSPVMT
jgi:hypothetical protein